MLFWTGRKGYDVASTMKVLQITAPGQAEWKDAPIPEIGANQALVKIHFVTTCPHWDLHIMDGVPMFADHKLTYPYWPGQPGHEAIGEVVACGDRVEMIRPGMRVAVWRDGGPYRPGCYAQYAPWDAENLIEIPGDIPDAGIASLELAMCVQVSFDQLNQIDAVRDRRFGISGLGPAGLIAVQMARAYGAREVIAIDPLPQRRELALRLGADSVLEPGAADWPAGRQGVHALDAALDSTGLKVSIEYLMARTQTAVAIFGVLREMVQFTPEQWYGGFSLIGYGAHNRLAAERALQLIIRGALDLTPLVTHRLPFSRYAKGVELLRQKQAIKVGFAP